MQQEARELRTLIYKSAKTQLTQEEADRLEEFINRSSENADLVKLLTTDEGYEAIVKELQERKSRWNGRDLQLPDPGGIVRRLFMATTWLRIGAAASVVIIIGSSIILFNSKPVVKENEKGLSKDLSSLLPGQHRGTLTLADNSTINLDAIAVGKLAEQGGANIEKSANGVIEYKAAQERINAGLNILQTPVGGDYTIKLEDGSICYLNAKSTLRYPATFTEKERKVFLSGEGYFEIAKNTAKPFLVETEKGSVIKVTGTKFNINTYADEAIERTSLVEGGVILSAGNQEKKLIPGQQAFVNKDRNLFEVKEANVYSSISWTKNNFNFSRATFKDVMRQLERWYGFKAIFLDNIGDDKQIQGGFSRSISLDEVMAILKRYEPDLEYGLNDKRELTLFKSKQ